MPDKPRPAASPADPHTVEPYTPTTGTRRDLIEKLRERLNQPPKARYIDPGEGADPGIPTGVQPPPMFRQGPTVVGTELGRHVEDLLRLAPELRGRIGQVQEAPTAATTQLAVDSGYDPTQIWDSNLLGMFSETLESQLNPGHAPIQDRQIYLKPSAKRMIGWSTLPQTLAHEAQHAQGGGERLSQDTGQLYRTLLDLPQYEARPEGSIRTSKSRYTRPKP